MKYVIVILAVASSALASLEPAGYKAPGERLVAPLPTNYLPANSSPATLAPSNRYLTPSSPAPASRQYLVPEVPSTVAPSTPKYYGSDEGIAVSALPSRSYVPPTSLPPASLLAPPHTSTASQFASSGRRPADTYLQVQQPKPFGYSTPAPLATSARTPSNRYLAPTQKDKFSGYQYGPRDNALNNVVTPAKYEFQYRVNDNYGNDYSHQEGRDGDSTWGVYTVLLPDGRRQIVHYDADANGFRPRITYEEPQLDQYAKSGPY